MSGWQEGGHTMSGGLYMIVQCHVAFVLSPSVLSQSVL